MENGFETKISSCCFSDTFIESPFYYLIVGRVGYLSLGLHLSHLFEENRFVRDI